MKAASRLKSLFLDAATMPFNFTRSMHRSYGAMVSVGAQLPALAVGFTLGSAFGVAAGVAAAAVYNYASFGLMSRSNPRLSEACWPRITAAAQSSAPRTLQP